MERLENQIALPLVSWDGTLTLQIAPNLSVTAQVDRLPLGGTGLLIHPGPVTGTCTE